MWLERGMSGLACSAYCHGNPNEQLEMKGYFSIFSLCDPYSQAPLRLIKLALANWHIANLQAVSVAAASLRFLAFRQNITKPPRVGPSVGCIWWVSQQYRAKQRACNERGGQQDPTISFRPGGPQQVDPWDTRNTEIFLLHFSPALCRHSFRRLQWRQKLWDFH